MSVRVTRVAVHRVFLDSDACVYLKRMGSRFEPDKVIHENYLRGRISNQEIRNIANEIEARCSYFFFRWLWVLLVLLIAGGILGFIRVMSGVIGEERLPFWWIHVDIFGCMFACLLLCVVINKITLYYINQANAYINYVNGDLLNRRIRVSLVGYDILSIQFVDSVPPPSDDQAPHLLISPNGMPPPDVNAGFFLPPGSVPPPPQYPPPAHYPPSSQYPPLQGYPMAPQPYGAPGLHPPQYPPTQTVNINPNPPGIRMENL
eukprot:TRINITY_DN387_c0_g4_i4.p1 TRINITY_DN387_c0_g4~~TRINITY_DN387_c0_g4_i4.p1  ORF type:complete len:261 (+),score=24.55 TRINITY_DN387_c0_g4_i4:96-878(+)